MWLHKNYHFYFRWYLSESWAVSNGVCLYSQACFYGSSCQAQLPDQYNNSIKRFVFQKPVSHKFKSVSTIAFIYFNDIVDFMIFHCRRGSKSNNALETGPRLKNDWLYYMFLFAFPFTFELCLFGSFSWSSFSVWLNSHWTLFAFFARQVEFQTSNAIEIVPN